MEKEAGIEDLKEVSELVKARCAGKDGLDLNKVVHLLTLTGELLLPDFRVEINRKF